MTSHDDGRWGMARRPLAARPTNTGSVVTVLARRLPRHGAAPGRGVWGPPVALRPHASPCPGPARHPAAVRRRPAAAIGPRCRRARRRGADPPGRAHRGRCGGSPPDSSARPGRRVGRPAGPRRRDRGGACRRRPRLVRGACEVAFDRILAYHAQEGAAARGHGRRRHHGGASHAGGRARRHLRPGRPGPLSLDRPHVRRPGPGGRGRHSRTVRPSGRGRQDRRGHAVRGVDRRDRRGVPDRWRAGRSRPWPTARTVCRRSTSSPDRATPTWPRPSARCPESSAWRPLSPDRPRSSSWPGRRPRPRSPPSTWSCRPSTGPTAWPGWSAGMRPTAERVSAEVDRIVAALTPAGRPGGHPGDGGDQLPGRRAGAGAGGRQRHRARAPAADGSPRSRDWRCSDLVQNAGAVFIGPVVAGQHGRLHRRAEPRAPHQPHRPLRLGAAGRRLPQAHPRGARDAGSRCASSGPPSSPWPRPRACRPTPSRCAAAWTRSASSTRGAAT